jgi:hypothetical protein
MTLQSDPATLESSPALVAPDLTVLTDDEQVPAPHRPALRELPLVVVLTAAAVGLIVVALHHFRWGNLILGGSLLMAALMRLVLPTRQAGLLAVRSRFTDALTMSLLGGSLMLLTVITRT